MEGITSGGSSLIYRDSSGVWLSAFGIGIAHVLSQPDSEYRPPSESNIENYWTKYNDRATKASRKKRRPSWSLTTIPHDMIQSNSTAKRQDLNTKPYRRLRLRSLRLIAKAWRTILSVCNVVLMICLSGAILAKYISPVTLITPAFLGLAFPILFVLQICFTLYWLIIRRWGRGAVNSLLLLVSLHSLMLYSPIRSKQTIPDADEGYIKLLTFNVNAFRFVAVDKDGHHMTTDYLADSDADIICLQEAWLRSNRSKYMSERKLRKALADYPYYSSAYAVKDHGSRLIVLSKYPIISTRPIDLRSDFNGGAVFTIKVGEKKLILYNLHLESFGLTPEDKQQYLDMAHEGKTEHLSKAIYRKFTPSFKARAKQVEQVYQDIHYQESPYVVVCGDFNDTPISYTHHRLSSGLNDAIATTGVGANFSYWLRNLVGIRIDHIVYSDMIECRAAQVDPSTDVSDHKPLFCYIRLKD